MNLPRLAALAAGVHEMRRPDAIRAKGHEMLHLQTGS